MRAGAGVGVAQDDGELVFRRVGEVVGGDAGVALADVEADGLAGGGFDAEAIEGGGGFVGFGVGVEGLALVDGVLDDDGAGVGGGVVDDVRDLGDVEGGLLEDAFAGGDVLTRLGVVGVVGGDADGLVDGVGEQALLGGMDGVEQAFAAEVAVLDDGEGAAVEREVGGVGDPERAQRRGLCAATRA